MPVIPVAAVDLTPLIQVALSFLAVVVPALGAYIAFVIKQRTNIAANSAAASAVDAATTDGAGLAYKLLAQLATNVPHTVEIQNAVIAAGVQHALAAAGDSAAVREETGASLGQTIAAKLGTLMAADPNVSIGPVVAAAPTSVGHTSVSTTEATPTGGTTTTTTIAPTVPVAVPVPPVPPAA